MSIKYSDSGFLDGADETKKLSFDVSGVTTGTTRTITMPDGDTKLYTGDGTSGQVLTSGGTGVAPTFQAAAGGDNTPSFSVSLSGNQSVSTGTETTMSFNTESWDTDNAWDTTNYKFTVPSDEAGKYFFNFHAMLDGMNTGAPKYLSIRLRINGTIDSSTYHYVATPNNDAAWANASWILPLSVSDYVEASVFHTWGSSLNVHSTFTRFRGFKLAGV